MSGNKLIKNKKPINLARELHVQLISHTHMAPWNDLSCKLDGRLNYLINSRLGSELNNQLSCRICEQVSRDLNK